MTKIIDDGLIMFNLGNNYHYKNLEIKKYKDNSDKAGLVYADIELLFSKERQDLEVTCDCGM